MPKTAAIVVSHNSEHVLDTCLKSLAEQTQPPDRICIVDSASKDIKYLEAVATKNNVEVVFSEKNIGFGRANNVGFAHVCEDADYVLFVNPDTLIEKSFMEQGASILDNNHELGIVTGRMLGYDFIKGRKTGRIDSTGIFRKWYGRWYDRGMGEKDEQQFMTAEDVPCACGALLFCRINALKEAELGKNSIFDPDFFLYKEDIELSLRMRKSGWRIRYFPQLLAFHGRGWEDDRAKMSRELRKMAAKNEVLLYRKHPSPYILWALAKYFLVRVFNI